MAAARKRKATKKPPVKKPAKKAAPPAKPRSPKIKRQLAAAKANATKRRKAREAREAESKAQAKQRALDAKRKRKRDKKAKATARQKATRARKGGLSLLATLENAYRTMQSVATYALGLSIERSPVMERGQQPWLLLGTFTPEEPMTWSDVGRVTQIWRDDDITIATVHPQRYSFLRYVYQLLDDEGEAVGKPQGYAPHSSGGWEKVINEAVEKLIGDDYQDPDEGSMAARYPNTQILAIEVLWSASLA